MPSWASSLQSEAGKYCGLWKGKPALCHSWKHHSGYLKQALFLKINGLKGERKSRLCNIEKGVEWPQPWSLSRWHHHCLDNTFVTMWLKEMGHKEVGSSKLRRRLLLFKNLADICFSISLVITYIQSLSRNHTYLQPRVCEYFQCHRASKWLFGPSPHCASYAYTCSLKGKMGLLFPPEIIHSCILVLRGFHRFHNHKSLVSDRISETIT